MMQINYSFFLYLKKNYFNLIIDVLVMNLCKEIHTLEVCSSNPPTKESSCAG